MNDFPYLVAKTTKENAVAKNSGFKVGAYLITEDLTYASGNIEHSNSVLNMCAERMVLMMAKGKQLTPVHLYLVTDNEKPTFPCGLCRQYMSEFPRLKVTVYSADGNEKITKTASQLLPNPFNRDRKAA